MNRPVVSVLMSAYNAAQYVEQAVESVLAQTMVQWELLVADDASTDKTLTILRRFADSDSRIRLFPQAENRGFIANRNMLLRQAQGDFVCILDADDWFSPDTLEQAVAAFSASDVDSVVLSLVYYYTGQAPQVHEIPNVEQQDMLSGEEAFRMSLDWTLHGLMLVRRELHLRYPYDERLRWYSDDNTVRLHYLHSRKVAFCKGKYHYRKHASSGTMSVSPQRFLHMQANKFMADTLREEGMPAGVVADFERVRWHNYVALLRLFHLHSNEFSPSECRRLRAEFRMIYSSFHRSMPYVLFLFRQWLGYVWKKYFIVFFGK